MKLLTTFAALSMAGTVILSLLPDGGIKRTAGMAVGLLALLCWAEGISGLLQMNLSADLPVTLLSPTAISIEQLETRAAEALVTLWEEQP